MNIRHYLIMLFTYSIVLLAACGYIVKKVKTEEPDCKICLEKTEGFGERYGDIIIRSTPKGNFLKYRCYKENKLICSAGRDSIEHILDTIDCRYINNAPDLAYEDDILLVITQNCGTYCWVNTFIYTNCRKPPVYGQAYFIDTYYYRFVSAREKENGEVFFSIQDLEDTSLSWTVKANYSRHSGGGFAYMHINDVFLKGDTVFYSIDSNGKVIRDSVIRE